MAKYQVFISFKNTDSNGQHTKDYHMAYALYTHLINKGIKVFFSEETLEILGDSDYKAAIEEALDAVNVLVVVGTSAEHLNSKWVKYEWDSFHQDILSDLKDAEIFSYLADLDIHTLPRALRSLQAVQHNEEDPGISISKLYNFIKNSLGIKDDSEAEKIREPLDKTLQKIDHLLSAEGNTQKEKQELYSTLEEWHSSILVQGSKVENLKGTIQNISASVNYSRRFQLGLMHSQKDLERVFGAGNYFVYDQPKDIVSGDFFWCCQFGDTRLVLVADCTGFGVPGALIAAAGISLLHSVVNEENVHDPAKILDELNRQFNIVVNKPQERLFDGMDVGIVSIRDKSLNFSSAYSSSLLVNSKEELIEFQKNKRPIGGGINYSHTDFSNQSYDLQKEDEIFLYTDGILDQIGGPDNKKLKSRRFKELVQNTHLKPISQQAAFVEESVLSWQGEQFQVDDMMILGIKI